MMFCHFVLIHLCQVSVPSTTLAHVVCVGDTALYPMLVLLLNCWCSWFFFLQMFFWHCISVFLSPLSLFNIMGGFTCWLYCFLRSFEWSMYLVFVPMYEADVVARHLCISVRWFIYYIDTHSFLFQWGFQQFLLTVFAASCFRDASCSFLFLSLGHFLDWRLYFLHLVLFLVLGT